MSILLPEISNLPAKTSAHMQVGRNLGDAAKEVIEMRRPKSKYIHIRICQKIHGGGSMS